MDIRYNEQIPQSAYTDTYALYIINGKTNQPFLITPFKAINQLFPSGTVFAQVYNTVNNNKIGLANADPSFLVVQLLKKGGRGEHNQYPDVNDTLKVELMQIMPNGTFAKYKEFDTKYFKLKDAKVIQKPTDYQPGVMGVLMDGYYNTDKGAKPLLLPELHDLFGGGNLKLDNGNNILSNPFKTAKTSIFKMTKKKMAFSVLGFLLLFGTIKMNEE